MFLADIISKQKKQVGERPIQQKKYVRRGDLEKAKQVEQAKEIETKEETIDKNEKEHESEEKKEIEGIQLTEEETMRRLRARGQVVTYFGETSEARLKRLHKLEDKEPLEYIHGSQNEVGIALRKLEETESNKKKRKEGSDAQPKKLLKLNEEINATNQTKEAFVLSSFKRLLRIWNDELEERTEIQKKSAAGKQEQVNFMQTKKNIKPLFKLLVHRSVDEDLLLHIHTIAIHLNEKEYVKAHDAYLRMAIGNAPWPMGVTMVGIHERSAREKINSGQVAHVLNDESQRKYIQSVKRLMTYCQKKFPTDPSKTVG